MFHEGTGGVAEWVSDMPPPHSAVSEAVPREKRCWDLSEKVSCSKQLLQRPVSSKLPAVCPAWLRVPLSESVFQVGDPSAGDEEIRGSRWRGFARGGWTVVPTIGASVSMTSG